MSGTDAEPAVTFRSVIMHGRRGTTTGVIFVGVAVATLLMTVACGGASTGSEAAADEPADPVVPASVGTLTRTTLRSYVTAYGTVEPEPPREGDYAGSARVTSRVAGVVAEMHCREGQRVNKGALLFRLDSRAIDLEIERARQAVTFAEQEHDRQRQLLEIEGTALRQVQQAELQLAAARNALAAAETQRTFLDVRAPIAGIVMQIAVRPGEAVDATRVLADVVDPGRLVATVRVPSANLGQLAIGQPVEILLNRTDVTAASEPVRSTVTFIDSALDPATDTAIVRARLPERAFRPGQFVTVRIVVAECQDCLAAPLESVSKNAEGRTVLALVNGDIAEQRVIEVGLRSEDFVEVRGEGLSAGQTIVTTGAYALPPRTRIRPTNR